MENANQLVQKHGLFILNLIRYLARTSSSLVEEDIEDIYTQVIIKLVETYIGPNPSSVYIYINEEAERGLIYRVTEQVFWRVSKQRQDEVKRFESLTDEEGNYLPDKKLSPGESLFHSKTETQAVNNIMTPITFDVAADALEMICQDPLYEQVLAYYMCLIGRDALDITDNYLYVIKHRIKSKLLSYLEKRI